MTRAERAALRGGAPGGCNPIAYGQCAQDPPGTGCAVNGGTCSTYNNNCVDPVTKKPLPPGTDCASGLENGNDPPQCQNSNDNLGACVQGNPPPVLCYDIYESCECDGNGNCTGDATPQDTGSCADATGNF